MTYKKTIDAGPIRIEKYYTAIRERDKPSVTRERHRNRTTEQQKTLNEMNAKERLRLLINANFKEGADWWVALTHADNPDEAENRNRFEKFVDRANYYLKKQDRPKVEYIAIGDKGKKSKCKWHVHAIIRGLQPQEIMQMWKNNFVFFRPLYIDGRYEELAGYIVEKKREKGTKRWWQSKGLEKPKVTVEQVAKRDLHRLHIGKKPCIPKGYREVSAEMTVNDLTGTAFRFEYIKDTEKKKPERGKKIAKQKPTMGQPRKKSHKLRN